MFGIDLGITVSSVVLVTEDNRVLDFTVLFGDPKDKDEWRRVNDMAEAICDTVGEICKSMAGTIVDPLVSVEEPVFSYRVRNYRSFFNLSLLYALVRRRLEVRNFEVYSINPASAKATARAMAFKDSKIPKKWADKRLNKKGMVEAYRRITGHIPNYSNGTGRETIADSFFIAKTGIDRRKVGVR